MKKATIKRKKIIIPTYGTGDIEKNPMFFEKRVYQGSSGKVYPNPVIEKICDEKYDREYDAVILENKYIEVIVLPELGGRIYSAYDKTNDYNFVYRNNVIKPALVGLCGPWISGGIEFNWPQHHRPSTYMPCYCDIRDNNDGSVSVILGEIDNMYSLEENTEIKIYTDKSIIEINVRIYNRSDLPQTFLWWANPAYSVNEYTTTVMPPDVTAVMDHGKRAVSTYPIATGEYYKMDYSKGVDISKYKNLPVPTSFMAYKSNFDFVGAYDYSKKAGLYHIADHRISPGKKQWTWGSGDFGLAWDRNLTDGDGPYIELMTGCFTDNQPDFTFIQPFEEKSFTQYFMPYKNVGEIKNANKDFCLNFENNLLKIHSTGERDNVRVKITDNSSVVYDNVHSFTPDTVFVLKTTQNHPDIEISYDSEVLKFSSDMVENFPIPMPATACPSPKDCKTNEELYLCGLHLEQYRHATRLPSDYYIEGLSRDKSDSRINNAYGLLLLRSGRFEESIVYFDRAIEKIIWKNPNPITTEPYYNKGIALLYMDKYAEAYDCFYKCLWSNENKTGAYYYLAIIALSDKKYIAALEFVRKSIQYNSANLKARNLLGRILIASGNHSEAEKVFLQIRESYPMDIISSFEIGLIGNKKYNFKGVKTEEIINLCNDYIVSHQFDIAENLLEEYVDMTTNSNSIIYYYIAYLRNLQCKSFNEYIERAEKVGNIICFPSLLRDIIVLECILKLKPDNYLVAYHLGNLYYDKKQYFKADSYWQIAEKKEDFATPYRNRALYFYNKKRDSVSAVDYMEKAFNADKTDSRIFMELFQLYKINKKDNEFLLKFILENIDIASERDDTYIEYLSLLNDIGQCTEAEKLILARKFHPWEGGEGKVTRLYKRIKINIADRLCEIKDYNAAISKLEEALKFPHNLGEGKLTLDNDNDIYYKIGKVYSIMGDKDNTERCFILATRGIKDVSENLYYNDTPVEYVYYAGLAYIELGMIKEVVNIINNFNTFYEKNISKKYEIDYFAVSLPDLLVWEQDLNLKFKNFCMELKQYADKLKNLIS